MGLCPCGALRMCEYEKTFELQNLKYEIGKRCKSSGPAFVGINSRRKELEFIHVYPKNDNM